MEGMKDRDSFEGTALDDDTEEYNIREIILHGSNILDAKKKILTNIIAHKRHLK